MTKLEPPERFSPHSPLTEEEVVALDSMPSDVRRIFREAGIWLKEDGGKQYLAIEGQAEQIEPLVVATLENARISGDAEGDDAARSEIALWSLGLRMLQTLGSRFNAEAWSFALNMLGHAFGKAGRHEEADGLLEYNWKFRENLLGANHPDTLLGLHNFAVNNLQLERFEEGVSLLERVCALREEVLRSEHPHTLLSMHALANGYRHQGRIDEAALLLERVYDVSRHTPGECDQLCLMALEDLARTYRDQGRLDEAKASFERVCELHAEALGPEHPDTIASTEQLALFCRDQGDLDTAVSLFERVFETRNKTLGPHHSDTLLIQNDLALAELGLGRLEEAQNVLERACAATESVHGRNALETLPCLYNLARVHQERGQHDLAYQLLVRVCAASERTLGAEAPLTLERQHSLAMTHNELGRITDPAELLERVYETSKRILGKENDRIPIYASDLANIHFGLRNTDRAVSLLKMALDVSRRVHPADHPMIPRILDNLAFAYCDQACYTEAFSVIEQACELTKQSNSPEHPLRLESIHGLARLQLDAGRIEEAVSILEPLCEASDRILGRDHEISLMRQNDLATAYQEQGRIDEAAVLLERACGLDGTVQDLAEPGDKERLGNLAGLYHSQGRLREAATLLERLLESSKRRLGPQHPKTTTCANNLAVVCFDLGDMVKATRLAKDAAEMTAKVRGPEHPETLTALNNLAYGYREEGKLEEAEKLWKKVLEISQRVLENDHPLSLRAVNNLGWLYCDQGRLDKAATLLERACETSERLYPQHAITAGYLANLAGVYSKMAQTNPECETAAGQSLYRALAAHAETGVQTRQWFSVVRELTEEIAPYVDEPTWNDWPALFDRLSGLCVEGLEIQPEETLDGVFDDVTSFHGTYIAQCLRHGLAVRVPGVLSRLQGRRLAALVWERLVDEPPAELSESDRRFLRIRRQLAGLILKSDAIGFRDEDFSSPGGLVAPTLPVARADQSGEDRRLWLIEALRAELKQLRTKLSPRLQNVSDPGKLDFEELQASLHPGQGLLMLVDLATGEASYPFAVLVRQDMDVPSWAILPDLPGLAWIFDLETRRGDRGVERRGGADGTVERVGFNAEDAGDGRNESGLALILDFLAEHLSGMQTLSDHLRAGEIVLESETYRRWNTLADELLQLAKQHQHETAEDKRTLQLIEQLAEAILDYSRLFSVSLEESERLMRRYLWEPLREQLGEELRGVDELVWVTFGRTHALPFDTGRSEDFPELVQLPGMLFLREPPVSPTDTLGLVLMHAFDATKGGQPYDPIPFVYSSQAIDTWFLGQFVGTPMMALRQAVRRESSCHGYYVHASISGHGSQDGSLPLRSAAAATLEEPGAVRWDDWIASGLGVREAEVWTCFLGNVKEDRGEPLGWPAALRLTGTTAMVGATRSISDFWTPLLQIIYRQTQFLAAEPKRAPQDALREAKRRLLSGEWYDAAALAPDYRTETTAALICRFYPLGMMKALEPLLERDCGEAQLNRVLADWPLPEHWRQRLPPPGERSKAAREQLTAFLEAVGKDAGEKLIVDTLSVLTDRARLATRPEVQSALKRLAAAFVCFGRADYRRMRGDVGGRRAPV